MDLGVLLGQCLLRNIDAKKYKYVGLFILIICKCNFKSTYYINVNRVQHYIFCSFVSMPSMYVAAFMGLRKLKKSKY